jgi:hypothetical protein
MATTACPRCSGLVKIPENEDGACSHCNAPLRFIDVPERPCSCCCTALILDPRFESATCSACGHIEAVDARRIIEFVANCPRCRREITVDETQSAVCRHCGCQMNLQDTV